MGKLLLGIGVPMKLSACQVAFRFCRYYDLGNQKVILLVTR